MRVRYTETALADIDSIFSYIHGHDPAAAAKVVESIEAAAGRIGLYPLSARETDETGVRMVPIVRFPYLIFYEIVEGELRILRVLHGARLRP
jgi:toxin ParE1/3/4